MVSLSHVDGDEAGARLVVGVHAFVGLVQGVHAAAAVGPVNEVLQNTTVSAASVSTRKAKTAAYF